MSGGSSEAWIWGLVGGISGFLSSVGLLIFMAVRYVREMGGTTANEESGIEAPGRLPEK